MENNSLKGFNWNAILTIFAIIIVGILAAAAFNLTHLTGKGFYSFVAAIALVWLVIYVVKAVKDSKEMKTLKSNLLTVAQRSSEERLGIKAQYDKEIAALVKERNEAQLAAKKAQEAMKIASDNASTLAEEVAYLKAEAKNNEAPKQSKSAKK